MSIKHELLSDNRFPRSIDSMSAVRSWGKKVQPLVGMAVSLGVRPFKTACDRRKLKDPVSLFVAFAGNLLTVWRGGQPSNEGGGCSDFPAA